MNTASLFHRLAGVALVAALGAALPPAAAVAAADTTATTVASEPLTSVTARVHLPVPYMRQPDNQTCLPTCLLMAMHFMGREPEFTSATVQQLHKRAWYDRFNVPPIAADYGLHALPSWYDLGWTRRTVEHELDQGRPVVLGSAISRSGHFVLAIGYTADGRLIIHDPTLRSPGYDIGGPDNVIDWEELYWRGGIILRPEPFPPRGPVSGTTVETTAPRRVAPGETFEVAIAVRNNGTEPWPDGVRLAPIVPETSPTQLRASAFRPPTGWVSEHHAAEPDKRNTPTSETAVFRFPLRAPQVGEPTAFLERWNLVDAEGRGFGSSWLAGPGDYEMFTRITVDPATGPWELPLVETTTGTAPVLRWTTRAGVLSPLRAGVPPAPDAMRAFTLHNAAGTSASAYLGDPAWTDYRVEAWVYCDLRKAEEKEGYDRVGIFIRDQGDRCGDTKDGAQMGACYAMTFDTDDGGIRAASIDTGGIDDFRPGARFKLEKSGWHKFAIRCTGDELVYELDGREFWKGRSRLFRAGDCGVYYRTAFEPGRSGGVSFAGFRAEK